MLGFVQLGHFNPPSPWGGGTIGRVGGTTLYLISIHPPRGGEGHWPAARRGICQPYFNPPSPWGGGTRYQGRGSKGCRISIHPPRGGEGLDTTRAWLRLRHFNPPSPWGGGTAKVHKNPFLFHALLTNSLAFFVTASCFLGENQKTGGEFVKISVRRSQGNPGRFPLAPV